MTLTTKLVLPDSRVLAYSEFGQTDGSPVFYFHGSPSCRLEPSLIGEDRLRATGLRFIAIDRPGMGQSDFLRERTFTEWPNDVAFVADALGIERFGVFGNSGGGVYAAVCASRLADRITSVVVVSGAGPMNAPEVTGNLPFANRIFWLLAERFSLGLRGLLKTMQKEGKASQAEELRKMERFLVAPDLAAMSEGDRFSILQAITRECLSRGTKGAAWDARLYVRPFGFSPEEITIPIRFFHGEQDMNVPLALVRSMVSKLDGASLTVFPQEGHLSTLCNHFEEIVETLVSGQ
ncbi:alpha/beta hydrolase [Rhodanobacter sp. L36]|uniref:alpha/beta fold hydrolase n=1 Tax=Rhodanobacter sp. L36 TaxID=1747221 RepID=UPI00131B5A15|nr:alpha/beta hydrolase [Rhodanobacter sp. L36]